MWFVFLWLVIFFGTQIGEIWKKLYEIIEAGNYKLNPKNENEFKLSTNITIFIISFLLLSYIFNYLNDKIEKLKSEETEEEKIKML